MYRKGKRKNLVSITMLLIVTLLAGGCGLGGKNSLELEGQGGNFLNN